MGKLPARIYFAANDDHGNFTGHADRFDIELPDGERVDLAIDLPVAHFKSKRGESIRIGGRGGIRVPSFGWRRWVGNMAWEGTSVDAEDAKKVVRYLLERGAVAESCDLGGELEEIVTRRAGGAG